MFLIYSFNIGGIERQLIEMCNAMAAENKVWLCVINRDYTESLFADLEPKVSVIRLDKTPGHSGQLAYMRKLASVVRDEHIDILHCQGINCVLFSALVKLCSPRTRILNTVHDIGNYSSYSSAKIFAQNRICDMTIAISHSVEKEIRSRSVPSEKIITIYNAINTEKFQYCAEKSLSCTSSPLTVSASCNAGTDGSSEKLPASGKAINICNVARFYPEKKGQDLLAEAVRKLLDLCPDMNICCTFAGAPAAGQEEKYEQLQQSIRADGLENHFSFLGNVDDIPALLAQQDIFVLPSRYEGFGISLVEAMAAGLPCAASDLDGPAEIMTAGNNCTVADEKSLRKTPYGILFRPGDSDSLTAALREIIRHQESYDRQMISDYARETYSMSRLVKEHLELYTRLLH